MGTTYNSTSQDGQSSTEPVTKRTSEGGSKERTTCEDRHNRASLIVAGLIELALESRGGNDLGNDTEIITVEQRTKGCKQTHEELVYFGRERHGDCRRC